MNTEEHVSPEKEVMLNQALEKMNEAFLVYEQTVRKIMVRQDDLIKKAMRKKEQEHIQSILDSLK